MVSISFTDPVYLWFLFSLLILILSHSVTFKNTRKKALRFANFEAISRVTGEEFIKKNVYLLVIRLIILALIVLAVSGTAITYTGISTSSNYVIALDTSASMLVQDINQNRLAAAQDMSISFLDFLPLEQDLTTLPNFFRQAFCFADTISLYLFFIYKLN